MRHSAERSWGKAEREEVKFPPSTERMRNARSSGGSIEGTLSLLGKQFAATGFNQFLLKNAAAKTKERGFQDQGSCRHPGSVVFWHPGKPVDKADNCLSSLSSVGREMQQEQFVLHSSVVLLQSLQMRRCFVCLSRFISPLVDDIAV